MRSARVVEYAAWLQRHDESVAVLDDIDTEAAKRQVNELLIEHPDGRDLTDAECSSCSRCYGIDLWDRMRSATADEAVEAAEELGWDVVLKATAERLRAASRPGARVAQHRRRRRRCGTPGSR